MDKNNYHWSVHGPAENIRLSVLVFILILTASLCIYYIGESFIWLALALVVLFVEFRTYFFPVDYFLTQEGVLVKGLFYKRQKDWSYFKRFYVDKKGVFLSPFAKPSRLENYRGIYLRKANTMNEVVEFIKVKIERGTDN